MKKTFLLLMFVVQHSFCQNYAEDFLCINETINNLNELNFRFKIKQKCSSELTYNLDILKWIISDNGETHANNLNNVISNFKVKETSNNSLNSIKQLILGYKLLNYNKDKIHAFISFKNAYVYSLKTKNNTLIKYSLLAILNFYRKEALQNDNSCFIYLNKYKEMCENKIDWLYYYTHTFNLLGQTKIYNEKKSKTTKPRENIINKFDSLINTSKAIHKPFVFYYKDKGNFLIRQDPKTAIKYYTKSLKLSPNHLYFNQLRFILFLNFSRASSILNKHKDGLMYLQKSYEYINTNDSIGDIFYINSNKSNHFFKLKKYDSAFIYERKARLSNYSLNFQKHSTEVSKIREQLETEKKEKENLQLKQENLKSETKRKQNAYLFYGTLTFLLFGGIISILFLKNSRKKRQLAEQQKEIEQQKNITLLKEQELNTINAMVEGQEKERKRIAEDLHDNVGSVLATLKLHFENLKLNREKKQFDQEELYEKTENLIDETYAKIRHIAHEKNAGVIANQGLLVAVKVMAQKISSANKTQIEVIDFGLEKRLDNSIEISVFRIIQELITNILKHAEAQNATINISLYDDELNIIIEDNGKGFDTKKVELKNGIGLNSIQTRIQHLNGTFEIDSSIGNGTSIIINIPIE